MRNAVLILVVEDEAAIRDLLNVALEDDGYELLLAENGEEAVKLLDKHNETRGVVTDVRLGGKRKMSGWDVARHAREINPDIAIVYVSGDSALNWAVDGVPKSVMVVKPFPLSQITKALAGLLSESG